MKFDTLNDYSVIAGVGVFVIDEDGAERYATELFDKARGTLDMIAELLGVRELCKVSMIHASYQAARFGGRYIFVDPRGIAFFVSPVIRDGKKDLSVFGGPVLMTSVDDYIEFDVMSRAPGAEPDALRRALGALPVCGAAVLSMLSEQLFVNARHISDGNYSDAKNDLKAASASAHLDEYISSYFGESGGLERSLLAEEQRLIKTLAQHEIDPARMLINEILGLILFHTGKNLEVVRSRIMELLIILSRAAIRDGADFDFISKQKKDAFAQLDNLTNLHEIIVWLNSVLDRFTGFIFKNPYTKHADLVRETIEFIKANYHEKITLESAAASVHLAPQYLSKIFKEETGQSFRSFLNKLRIEQSKDMLHDASVDLTDVSLRVGYEDQSYFTKVFKRYEGVSPNQYRNSIR